MIRELAQAGNRAGKTGRYLQWRDSVAEQIVAAPVTQKLHNYHLIIFFLFVPRRFLPRLKVDGRVLQSHMHGAFLMTTLPFQTLSAHWLELHDVSSGARLPPAATVSTRV